jgi:hypothetical protein
MEPGERATITRSRRRAQLVVLAALLAALGIGWHESREISPADIPLADLPKQIGCWQVVSEDTSLSSGSAYKLLERTYRDGDRGELYVRIQATYTRLGSLRDWSLASMASGWSVEKEWTWTSRASGDGVPPQARMQKLVKGQQQRVALTWYASARSQAHSLQSAQVQAWRDRVLGAKKPWASMYIIAEIGSTIDAQDTVLELAEHLAPRLQQLMQEADPERR